MFFVFFFFKQKTAYELRISDWSSDVCSSDLVEMFRTTADLTQQFGAADHLVEALDPEPGEDVADFLGDEGRSEEHTSELQSLMRISYTVFCLKKKKKRRQHYTKI